MPDLNRVALTGNLTADAEIRGEKSNVLSIRLAVTGSSRNAAGEWVDVPNYFNVTLFGENRVPALAPYLTKGTRVAVDGRLRWREWEQDDVKRQAVEVIAEDVILLGGRPDPDRPPAA